MLTEQDLVEVIITESMRKYAHALEQERTMSRTRASPVDAWIGLLGELTWAQLRYNDPFRLDLSSTKGKVDDDTDSIKVEIKASKTNAWLNSHLMVRQDYASRRAPDYYVYVLIPKHQPDRQETIAYVCGWATHQQVLDSPLVERTSTRTQSSQGYRCHELGCRRLNAMRSMPLKLEGLIDP